MKPRGCTPSLSVWRRYNFPRQLGRSAAGIPFVLLVLADAPGCEGCAGFEAVSVSPTTAYDDEAGVVYIYGHGFEEGSTAVVSWVDSAGSPKAAAIENLEMLDTYTLRGTLPNLQGQLTYPIFPYKEFVWLSDSYTPGLYACTQDAGDGPQALVWEEGTTGPYCDKSGNPLAYVAPETENPRVPPGSADYSVMQYAAWYDLLASCQYSLATDTSLTEDDLARLIPDYGMGCFYPQGQLDEQGTPLTYSYCPLQTPSVEVDIVITLPDGKKSEIVNGLTLLDWSHDYYWNPRYGNRVRGRFWDYAWLDLNPEIPAMTLFDIDGDGAIDVLVPSQDEDTLSLFSGPYFDLTATGAASDSTLTLLQAAHLDEDSSYADIISLHGDDQKLTIQYDVELETVKDPDTDEESVTLQPSESATIGLTTIPLSVVVADLNLDGLPDVAVSGQDPDTGAGQVLLLLQNSAAPRSFGLSGPIAAGGSPSYQALGYLDANESIDLVTTDADNNTLNLWYNDGSGHFPNAPDRVISLGATVGDFAILRPSSPADSETTPGLTDLTGDGTVDIAVFDRALPRIIIVTEDGDAPLGRLLEVQTEAQPVALTLSFADADGLPDLIVADEDGGVSILSNEGRGDFAALSYNALDPGLTRVISQDIDADGLYDIVAVNEAYGLAYLLTNTNSIGVYFYYVLEECTL